jgi:hypothetical protein
VHRVARRHCFGQTKREAIVDTDQDEECVWSWEIVDSEYITKDKSFKLKYQRRAREGTVFFLCFVFAVAPPTWTHNKRVSDLVLYFVFV